MSEGKYTGAMDVWALGCIFGELLQRQSAGAHTPHLTISPLFRFDDDPTLRDLEAKRLAALKARFGAEKQFHAQGHGEYREIVEEEFLKEVCGSEHVVVHFYHTEFFRCKIVDKHMRIIAPQTSAASSCTSTPPRPRSSWPSCRFRSCRRWSSSATAR